MRPIIKPASKFFLMAIALCVDNTILAQDGGKAATAESSYNTVAILMITISIVLAFVIWGLGQVLITLSKQALDKSRQAKTVTTIILLIVCSFFSSVANAQETALTATVSPVVNYGGMTSTAFWLITGVLLIEVVLIAYILFFIRRIQAELMPARIKAKPALFKEWWTMLDKKLFTKAVAIEKEADILLDHDYDGIKELDNSLPPWWKYGFYITIVAAVIYMINFHVMGYGKNPTEEYQAEMIQAQIDKEIYEAKNADKIDESNLQMPAVAGLDAGKEIFTSVCWTCHGKAGEGGAGPNLTDDYWLHKGSLKDIYFSIKHGYPEKGMQSWEKSYSPKDINNLAGYIKTLRGTNPADAKAAQGDLDVASEKSDSTLTGNSVKKSEDITIAKADSTK